MKFREEERNCGNCQWWKVYKNQLWGACPHFEVINEGIDTMRTHSCDKWGKPVGRIRLNIS
jgi:hypothetical protein